MSDIDQYFKNSHYNIIRILLGISGLWPFHTRNRRYAIYLTMILVLGTGYIFQILGIVEVWHDSFELINAIPFLFFTTIALGKMICTVYTLPQIKVLLTRMREYRLSPKSNEETKIQNSHAQYGRKFGYAYTGFLLGHSVLYLLSSLSLKIFHTPSNETDELSDKESNYRIGLPHRANYIVDVDTYYVPIFIHSAICDFTCTYLLTVFDVLYLTVVEYCCGLFASLRYRLEIALVFNDDKLRTLKDKSYANIVYCIRRHAESMQFVSIVESVYSLSLLLHVGSFVLVISFLLYQVLNDLEVNANTVVRTTAYLNAVLFNVFFENWQGQKIIDSSEKVFESAYNTEWYNMPIATRKLLIIMMIKSEKPLMLKMGKVVLLSYITFNTVLRTSSSYFMLLRSL
ncbi:odorant receptor Or2 [Solenopsis invicta]|uniref:odorant receptor Or2 n=1 Tax=Solenopsis invicta TaxID=13686 RepID=UPI00193D367A|nr:odorant receptor Or2 [Solenopsis invicta]XP_039305978.1 odorant receptor Or2 [Solenopsis invicta]